jgi:hypothetical protein
MDEAAKPTTTAMLPERVGRGLMPRDPRPVSFGLIQVLRAGEPSRMTETGYHKPRTNQMMNAAIITIARCIARDAIEDQIRAEGRKVCEFAANEIKALASDYLAGHPELIEQAGVILAKFRSRAQRKRR